MVVINGKRVTNPQDEGLLRYLLNFYPHKHNGDENIDQAEAMRLLDHNSNDYIDELDVFGFTDIEKGDFIGAFVRCFRIFSDYGVVLKKSRSFVPDAKEILEKAAKQSAENNPRAALEYADRYKDQPYARGVLEKAAKNAAENNPRAALQFADRYKDQPYAKGVIEKAAEKAAEDDPRTALEFADRYKDQPYAKGVLEKAAKNAAENNPGAALEFADRYKDQPYGKGVLEKAAEKAAESDPGAALEFADRYKDQPYAKGVIEKAAERNPKAALEFASRYEDQPYAKGVIEKAAERNPKAALQFASRYEDQPYGKGVLEKAAESDPGAALEFADRYKDQPYAKGVIEKAAKKAAEDDPGSALEFADRYKDQPYGKGVIEKAAELDPASALGYIQHIRNFDLPIIKMVLQIVESNHPYKYRIAPLISEIVAKRLTIEDALQISKDDPRYFDTLVKIEVQPGHIGKLAVERELKSISLRTVQRINALHNEPATVRFKSVKVADAKKLYILMVNAEEEIFTSSFNGLFDRLLAAMRTEKLSGDRLIDIVGHKRFRAFIKLCAGYGRLNEFLATMRPENRRAILIKFVSWIDKEKNPLSEAVTVADAFGTIKDPAILEVLQKSIKEEYNRVTQEGKSEATIIYGLLAGMFGKKAVINEEWIKEMSQKYGLPDLTGIESRALFNPDGSNIQQYFFYDDKDGKSSFETFLAQYKGNKTWGIDEHDNYVLIHSKRIGGERIEIYANRPTAEGVEKGSKEIAGLFSKRNIQSIVVVHRGHSYHVQKTIKQISPIARIVSLGSCGGYNNVSAVFEKAPNAHIISTKGMGTMGVNDPLFKMMNEAILSEKDISWPEFWKRAEARFANNKAFAYYVAPHRNLGAMFIKAYHKLRKTSP